MPGAARHARPWGTRRAWDDDAARVSDGVAVRPSRRIEGCWDEAFCSFPAGPVAALAAGDGERRGRPPTGAFWATWVARAARRLARAWRASAMVTAEDHTRTAEERFQHTPTWRAKCRISGSDRPLRFEHRGARGDLSPTDLRPTSSRDLADEIDELTTQKDTGFILVWATIMV